MSGFPLDVRGRPPPPIGSGTRRVGASIATACALQGIGTHPRPPMTIESSNRPERNDIVFFSHLRWDFVFQRPQHIASRWGADRRAYFWEEPLADAFSPWLEVRARGTVTVI